MGPFSIAGAILVGSLIAGLTFDMGINALQNWYDVFYADAFWSHRVTSSPALDALAREEAEINRLLAAQDEPAPPRRN